MTQAGMSPLGMPCRLAHEEHVCMVQNLCLDAGREHCSVPLPFLTPALSCVLDRFGVSISLALIVLFSPCPQVVDSFDDMKLREDLLRGIYAYGFEKPSAIQQRAIVPCIQGHDVIAQCVL